MTYEFDQDNAQDDHYQTMSGKVEAPSVLRALDDAGIFSADQKGPDRIQFTDGCDHWYALSLGKEHLLALSDEIREMANTLEPHRTKNHE